MMIKLRLQLILLTLFYLISVFIGIIGYFLFPLWIILWILFGFDYIKLSFKISEKILERIDSIEYKLFNKEGIKK